MPRRPEKMPTDFMGRAIIRRQARFWQKDLWACFLNAALSIAALWFLSGCVQRLSVVEQGERSQKVEELLTRATLLMRENRDDALAEARAALFLAGQLMPSEARVSDGLGCIAFREKEYPAAEAWFSRAISLNPQYSRGYAHLALLAAGRGDMTGAMELFQHALHLNPLDARARNNFAVYLLEQGAAREKAEEQFLEALSAARSTEVREVIKQNVNRARFVPVPNSAESRLREVPSR